MNHRDEERLGPTNPTEANEFFTVQARPVAQPWAATEPHARVIEAIERYDFEVASWYRGAILTAGNPGNPDRLAQAGHNLREVMDSMSRLAGLPQPEEAQGGLRDHFDPLANRWRRAQSDSDCFDGSCWSGTIDGPASRAMRAVDELVVWYAEHRRARREVFLDATRQLDGSGRRLPGVEEDRLWRDWARVRNCFIAVAHHSKGTTDAEFDEYVAELDALLLRVVGGDVYREQKQILELIREVEADA